MQSPEKLSVLNKLLLDLLLALLDLPLLYPTKPKMKLPIGDKVMQVFSDDLGKPIKPPKTIWMFFKVPSMDRFMRNLSSTSTCTHSTLNCCNYISSIASTVEKCGLREMQLSIPTFAAVARNLRNSTLLAFKMIWCAILHLFH